MEHQKETENGKETGKKLQGPNLAQVQRGKKKTFNIANIITIFTAMISHSVFPIVM